MDANEDDRDGGGYHVCYHSRLYSYFKGLRPWAGSARRSPGRAISKHVEAPKLP